MIQQNNADHQALLDAVWQVLDDMGEDGLSCCALAKAQLRVAYEPFRDYVDCCGTDSDGLSQASLERSTKLIKEHS